MSTTQPPSDQSSKSAETPAPTSPPFYGLVFDFVRLDWGLVRPRGQPPVGQRQPGRRTLVGLRAAVTQAVLAQGYAEVVVPDIQLGQVLWGGDQKRWPRAWRRSIVKKLKRGVEDPSSGFVRFTHLERNGRRGCPEQCLLHGTGVRHQHFEIAIKTASKDGAAADLQEGFLGALEIFGSGSENLRSYNWRPTPVDDAPEGGGEIGWEDPDDPDADVDQRKALIKTANRLKHAGRLASVYWPIHLFGQSPLVGLSRSQHNLHRAITRELTRSIGRRGSSRPDRAEIIIGGQTSGGVYAIAPYPELLPAVPYVAFNGNGRGRKRHLHGRGYKLFTWMKRAGYQLIEGDEGKRLWREARHFLKDLAVLAESFGLIVAAWHPRDHTWRRLEDLSEMTKTEQGRKWLSKALLRIYAPEDYLARWRRFFASKMGFSFIPERNREESVPDDPISSPQQLSLYLSRTGVTQSKLAEELGVSKSLVSHYLSGRRNWTTGWQEKLASWLAGRMERV
jgi:hypothetical protein